MIKNYFILFFLFFIFLSSCVSNKDAVYFNNLNDTVFNTSVIDTLPVIQKNDLLSISVSSLNPEATIIFNTPNVTMSGGISSSLVNSSIAGGSSQVSGYLVNDEGNIQFPVIGNVLAAGLTKRQLTDSITNVLTRKKLLIDPIVNVRFLNFRVTVLGEVARPTVINVSNEKITILEALGFAGDLTIFAKRNNILLIRDDKEKRIIKRLNLNSSEILTSPYYFLKTNDIIYVEPNNTKVASTSNTRSLLPIILSGLSFFAIIIDRVLRNN